MNFHLSLKERASKGDVDFLFIGDSLTMGWDKEIWENRYAPRKAANFGVGGDGTPQLLWRLENGGFDGLKPQAIILLLGMLPAFDANDTIPQYAATVNAAIAPLADGRNLRFLDFGRELLGADGSLRQDCYQDDRLHLKKPAYETWAKAMEPVLSDLISTPR